MSKGLREGKATDMFGQAASGLGSAYSTPQQKPKQIEYKDVISILQKMIFDTNELKLFDNENRKRLYNSLSNLFLKSNTKSIQTFIIVEQQKLTNRTTVDFSKVIKSMIKFYNYTQQQKSELEKFIVKFIDQANKQQTDIKLSLVKKQNAQVNSQNNKNINNKNLLFQKIYKITNLDDWVKNFNVIIQTQSNILKLNQNDMVLIQNKFNVIYKQIKNIKTKLDKNALNSLYKRIDIYFKNNIFTPLQLNQNEIKTINYSFYKCVNVYLNNNNLLSETLLLRWKVLANIK
jgi:hypothetical protein